MSSYLRMLVSIWKQVIIVFSILLIASIVGAIIGFSLPVQVEKNVEVLNYEHKGKFDYVAYQKATYTHGDLPLEISPEIPETEATIPKYPADMINSIDMTFSYRFLPDRPAVRISEQVEVRAILVSGDQREEVVLVPEDTFTGDFIVRFPLDVYAVTSNSTTTITANVYTTVETDTVPIFESFSQSLKIQSKGPYLEVSKELTSSKRAAFGEFSYEQIGEFDYSIYMKPDSPFANMILGPPTPAPPATNTQQSATTLGPEDAIYLKLFEGMDVTFNYSFVSDGPVGQVDGEVEVNAILENPGVWRKTFPLVPLTKSSDNTSVSFPLDQENFSHFKDVFTAIQEETGTTVPHKVTIKADVHTSAQTPFGPIDEDYTQTLSTTLGGDTLQWEEEVEGSKPGALERTRLVPNPRRLAGFSVMQIRNLSLIAGILSFILLLGFTSLGLFYKPEELSPDEEAIRAKKKRKDVIVDVQELPKSDSRTKVVPLMSLDALIKTADNLLKPVFHLVENGKHTYCVIDGSIRYEYILTDQNEQQV